MRERVGIGVGKTEYASQNLRGTQYLQGTLSGKREGASKHNPEELSYQASHLHGLAALGEKGLSPLQANALPGTLSWAQESELLFCE